MCDFFFFFGLTYAGHELLSFRVSNLESAKYAIQGVIHFLPSYEFCELYLIAILLCSPLFLSHVFS